MESPMKYFAGMEDYREQGYVKHKLCKYYSHKHSCNNMRSRRLV